MRKRHLTSVIAAVLALAGLAGCGGSSGGSPGEIVARVAGVGTISRAMLDHWMPIEATVIYQEVPTKPVPKGVVPDPPGYADCIVHLKAVALTSPQNGSPKLTNGELKRQCERQNEELRQITLNTLILWYWTIGEGESLGIKLTDAEVRQRLATVNKTLFPGSHDFANYMKWTGQTLGDMLLRSRVQLFEVKTQEKTVKASRELSKTLSAEQRQSALAKLSAALAPAREWVPRTSCQPGYIASACKQYHGPLSPGLPN